MYNSRIRCSTTYGGAGPTRCVLDGYLYQLYSPHTGMSHLKIVVFVIIVSVGDIWPVNRIIIIIIICLLF